MNVIGTKCIGELILNSKTPNRDPRIEHYSIPFYQRGYRWEKQHVIALLDDIHDFIMNNEGKKYCLQPIVVSSLIDEEGNNIWEVIDGQQRLITISIIFKYIQKPRFGLKFEQRDKSTDFLEKLDANSYNHNEPDFHFMSDAHMYISEWFTRKTKDDISYIDEFYTTVTKKVQVIWYKLVELTDDEKIDVFNRLNIGKIQLTDSELIRALLLTNIKNETSEREATLRQAEISSEWNRIEHELRNDDLWYFLNNEVKEHISSRIEFVFNLIAGSEAENYSTFLWFELYLKQDIEKDSKESNVVNLWNKVKETFGILKSWYNSRTLYHYIGFLLAQKYPIGRVLAKSQSLTKSQFKKWLEVEISNQIEGYNLDELSYDEKNKVEKLLLLYNILSVESLPNVAHNRFPFNLYKDVENNGGWSIEHIHAQNSEEMKEEKAIRIWLEDTLKAIKNIKVVEKEVKIETSDDYQSISEEEHSVKMEIRKFEMKDYISKIDNLLTQNKIDIQEFNILKEELRDIFDSQSVHDLDNLALLGKKDNSALQNYLFPVKRNKIIELEKQGKFIPPCTRNVFLKFYTNADNQPYYWNPIDKKAYFNSIKSTILPFLK